MPCACAQVATETAGAAQQDPARPVGTTSSFACRSGPHRSFPGMLGWPLCFHLGEQRAFGRLIVAAKQVAFGAVCPPLVGRRAGVNGDGVLAQP